MFGSYNNCCTKNLSKSALIQFENIIKPNINRRKVYEKQKVKLSHFEQVEKAVPRSDGVDGCITHDGNMV